MRNIETVLQVHHKNRAQHDDHETYSAYANENSGQHGQPSGKLRQPHEVTYDHGHMHETCEFLGAGSAKRSKRNRSAVIEERHGTCDAKHQESEVQLLLSWGGSEGSVHVQPRCLVVG